MQKSKMKRLPQAIQDAVKTMLDDGNTISEITHFLQEAGNDISRSGVGRYAKEWANATEALKEARDYAEITMRNLEKMPENKINRLAVQLLESSIFRLSVMVKDVEKTDPERAIKLLESLALSTKRLSSSSRDDVVTTIMANDYRDDVAGDNLPENKKQNIEVHFVEANKIEDKKAENSEK